MGLEYLLCLKQVPDTTDISYDRESGSLIRENAGSIPNPHDEDALSACLDLRAQKGGSITALSMGPRQARATLRNALSLGVDRAYQLRDKAFAGADVYVTAYTLAQAIHKIGRPDIIFCGKQSIDGDTGQVGAELAELLGYAHIYYVVEICQLDDAFIVVKTKLGRKIQTVKVTLPCVICTESGFFPKKISSFRDKIDAQNKPIKLLTLADLEDNNPGHYGYKASPTKVRKLFVPRADRLCRLLSGVSLSRLKQIIAELSEEIDTAEKQSLFADRIIAPETRQDLLKVCVLLEEGELVGQEIIEYISQFRSGKKLQVEAVLPAKKHSHPAADDNLLDKLYIYPCNSEYLTTEHYIAAVSDYMENSRIKPDILLVGATALGRSFAPRIAAKFQTGLTADCTDIDIDDDKLLIQIRPAFQEELLAQIVTPVRRPQMASIRPGVLASEKTIAATSGRTELIYRSLQLQNPNLQVLAEAASGQEQAGFKQADIVVVAGNAVLEAGELAEIRKIAASLAAEVAVSRPLVQGGLAPHELQVGVSGASLSNKIAVLIGVSGSNQTLAGLKKVKKIIAINKDAQARIFDYADIGFVADWKDLLNIRKDQDVSENDAAEY